MTSALLLALVMRGSAVERTMSVYSDSFVGRRMANGHRYSHEANTVASNDWRLGTKLRISHGERAVIVTVTDRMARRYTSRRIDVTRKIWKHLTHGATPGLRRVKVKKI